jgi:hypothetical protein
VTNPYLEPVASSWARVAGVALLLAAAALTVTLVYLAFERISGGGRLGAFNSSVLVFGLILLALCGMCWQAGYRLAFRRPDRSGMLFSRPAWFAIGTGLVVITALMAAEILKARRPTLLDVQVILSLGGIGVWCLILALRRR